MPEAIPFTNLRTQYLALKTSIDARIQRVLDHGQYIMGPEVDEMEAALAARTGSRHCVSVASGTEALLIALMALGVKAGDEVITAPFSFASTAEVVVLLGARPVFVDVEPDTANIDAALIESAITPRTRAILPVSLYGQASDMAAINAIASRHGLPVVEDAAQSFGATFDGRSSGALSTIGCTSFFPSKPLGCYGDGGALFTDDDRLAQIAREIRVHGQSARYTHSRLGVGGRMDTLQCAVVLGKLERFDDELQCRQRIAERYTHRLSEALVDRGLPVQLPVVRPGRSSVWAQYTVQLPHREAVRQELLAAGVPTAVHYPVPLHRQPAYAHAAPEAGAAALPVSVALADAVLSLPMGPDLAAPDQDRVVEALAQSLQRLTG